jgi:hypothetical protein
MLFYTFILSSPYFQIIQILNVLEMLHCEFKNSRIIFKLITSYIQKQKIHMFYFQELFKIINLITIKVQEYQTLRLTQMIQLTYLIIRNIQKLQFRTHSNWLKITNKVERKIQRFKYITFSKH